MRSFIRSRMTPALGFVAVAGLVAGSASVATGHDFWLIPNGFRLAPGARIDVVGQTSSTFPTSLSAVTPDRVVAARVLTATSDVQVGTVSVRGASLALAHRPRAEGQHLVGVQLAPRSVRESPASFRHYLEVEGAPEALVRYEREGLLPPVGGDSITRRYAKYAKTLVEVGRGARSFHRRLGHPLEFVPLSDPSALRAGDSLRVQLVLLGQPAARARVHAGSIAAGIALTDTAAARRAAASDVSLEADDAGVVTVVIGRAGLWNVRTLQIVPAPRGSGADWDVHWATLTFRVGNP